MSGPSAADRGGVLVIGLGNPLRGDDGAGFQAAWLLALDPRLRGADVLVRRQLTPELAEDVAAASLVVLVDAAVGTGAPGGISLRWVEGDDGGGARTHAVDPGALAMMAGALYGRVPPILLVSVGAESLEPGTRLSAPVARALPEVVATVARLVEEAGPAREARPRLRRPAAPEVSLVAELVGACLARAGGAPVELVRVRRAATVERDVVEATFRLLAPGTVLAGADLVIEPDEDHLTCACGFSGALGAGDVAPGLAVCPACGVVPDRPPAAELELLEVRTAGGG
jgi:hydrogenase maturation protease